MNDEQKIAETLAQNLPKSAGVSFTVTSTVILDISTFNWLVIN